VIYLKRTWLWAVLAAGVLLVGAAASCGGSGGEAALSLQWVREDASTQAVAPTETLKSVLVVRNDGGKDLDGVTLRFNQNEVGGVPFGVSVGTVTNARSRFEGETQVWDLGSIGAGDSVTFPMTLWFESSSSTEGPITVRLVMVASTPGLPQMVESNPFEVVVDAGQAVAP
jgi:hypothetical protein